MTQETCIKCLTEPRQGTSKWGANCWRQYRANRKFARKPDEQTEVVAQTVTEVGEVEDPSGWHCEVCKRPLPEEPFLPPLDERTGWRVLGQDPIGWAEDHGPDFGLPCCRQVACYDARPGHRAWPPLVAV